MAGCTPRVSTIEGREGKKDSRSEKTGESCEDQGGGMEVLFGGLSIMEGVESSGGYADGEEGKECEGDRLESEGWTGRPGEKAEREELREEEEGRVGGEGEERRTEMFVSKSVYLWRES